MRIAGRDVGGINPCFIVAEAGVAHDGNVDRAYDLIDLAVDARADAVKFQVFEAGELVDSKRSPEWYERYKSKLLTGPEIKKTKEYAEKQGIIWFATPHTKSALDFLETLDPPCYKIGSGEKNSDLPDHVKRTGRPYFISTGLRTHEEITQLLMLRSSFSDNYGVLHCVTLYPTPIEKANLAVLHYLRSMCPVVGYSDHTKGITACLLAIAAGAKVIEKHVKLPSSTGQDTLCASGAYEFKLLVRKIRQVERVMGPIKRQYTDEERANESWALKDPSDGKRPLKRANS